MGPIAPRNRAHCTIITSNLLVIGNPKGSGLTMRAHSSPPRLCGWHLFNGTEHAQAQCTLELLLTPADFFLTNKTLYKNEIYRTAV